MANRNSAMNIASIFILKLLFVWPVMAIVNLIKYIARKIEDRRYGVDFSDYPEDEDWIDDDDNEQQIKEEITKCDETPEMPEMCQVFPLGEDSCIGVQYVSMCPDETAHIRIIGETSFSQLYKRRVYTEQDYDKRRYFKLNNKKYYLNPKRTQPINPVQAKEGK